MDKNAALCVYLKKYHTGKEKAVPSTELEQLFSLNGRNLRARSIACVRMAFLFAVTGADTTLQQIRKK